MLNKILLVIVVFLSTVLVVISSRDTTIFNEEEDTINVFNTDENVIYSLDLEEYIVGVVAAEMPASFNIEALKAQAIASRTYAVYKLNENKDNYDILADVTNQSYITIEEMQEKWGDDFEKYYNKILSAVSATKGLILTYEGEVIESFYFAMSNGYTEDVALVFGESLDYLQSVESIYEDESINNYEVTKTFTMQEICNLLELDCQTIKVTNIERSSTGRVLSLYINNTYFKGTTFRTKLSLRSTDFDIVINEDAVLITTRGYGHGVGMSQYGANGMANNGYTYEEILKYYYQNVEISSI